MNIPSPIPLSLRRKSSARLAAVQCIYRRKLTDMSLSADQLVHDYLEQWEHDKSLPTRVLSKEAPPDEKLFRNLITGVVSGWEELEGYLRVHVQGSWAFDRLSPLLFALLLCGVYELSSSPQDKHSRLIHDYVTLAGRFFDAGETGFVNAFLDGYAARPLTAHGAGNG